MLVVWYVGELVFWQVVWSLNGETTRPPPISNLNARVWQYVRIVSWYIGKLVCCWFGIIKVGRLYEGGDDLQSQRQSVTMCGLWGSRAGKSRWDGNWSRRRSTAMTSLLFHNNHSVLRLDDDGNVSQRVLFEVEVFLMYICASRSVIDLLWPPDNSKTAYCFTSTTTTVPFPILLLLLYH